MKTVDFFRKIQQEKPIDVDITIKPYNDGIDIIGVKQFGKKYNERKEHIYTIKYYELEPMEAHELSRELKKFFGRF